VTVSLPDAVYGGTAFKVGRDADNLLDFSTDNKITFRVNAADAGAWTSTGVGIGTTTPAAALQVLNISEQLRVGYNATQYNKFTVASDGGTEWDFLGTDADLNIDFSGATDGDFSIGTSKLFVDTSTGYVGINTSTPQALLAIAHPGGSQKFLSFSRTTLGDKFVIDNNGLVGISAATPNDTLDVGGTIDSTGVLKQGGTQVLYFPDQTDFTGTIYYGDGGSALTHTTGSNGRYNTAVGIDALAANTTGSGNAALGWQALKATTDGIYDIGIGYRAGYSNTSGQFNIAIGASSLYLSATSSYNIAIGQNSLYHNKAHYNVAIGYNAMYENLTSLANVAIGSGSLQKQTSGGYNISIGQNSMNSNNSGQFDTAVGTAAMQYASSSNDMVAIGHSAGSGNSSGYTSSRGIYIGKQSGYSLQNGSNDNIFLGYQSGYANTTGTGNLLLGYKSGDSITTGSKNIYIGYDVDASNATASNKLNIGNLIFANNVDGTGTTISTGSVGIGTNSPGTRLFVTVANTSGFVTTIENSDTGTTADGLLIKVGNTGSPGTGNNFIEFQNGTGTILGAVEGDGGGGVTSANIGADYAEYFYTRDTDLEAGEVVCLDLKRENAIVRCTNGSDGNVLGIISTHPIILGNWTPERSEDDNYKKVAMLGQIPAMVSAENGPVRVGDSLTSASSTPGHVMRANPGDPTVAVALENLSGAEGVIKVAIYRRNKSLTVEQVESEVAKRVAEMEIQDEVNLLIASAVETLNLDDQINLALDTRLTQVDVAGIAAAQALYDAETQLSEYVFNSYLSSTTPDELFGDTATDTDAYQMLTIDEMREFIIQNGHLPSITKRDEWNAGSLTIGELANQLWQTAEEQALYITELDSRLDELETFAASLMQNATSSEGLDPNAPLETTLNNTDVRGRLVVRGATFLNEDTIGQARIVKGAERVKIEFSQPYEFDPIVTITPINFSGRWRLTNISGEGFTIMLEWDEENDITFNWHAFPSGEKTKMFVSDGTTQLLADLKVVETTTPEPVVIPQVAGESTSTPEIITTPTSTPEVVEETQATSTPEVSVEENATSTVSTIEEAAPAEDAATETSATEPVADNQDPQGTSAQQAPELAPTQPAPEPVAEVTNEAPPADTQASTPEENNLN